MKNTTFHPDYLWHSMEERLSSVVSVLKSYWLPVVGLIILAFIAAVTLSPVKIYDNPQSTISTSSKPLSNEDLMRVSELFKIGATKPVPFYELNRPATPSPLLEKSHD